MGINAKNSMLVVIDVINFCCEYRTEKKIRKTVPKLVKFIKKYKETYDKEVIYVNCVRWDKKHLPHNLIELYKDPRCKFYTTDKSGHSEEFYKVSPEREDIIITKNTYDAFTNPKLDALLKRKKIKYLIVAGVFGDGCVHATIQGGFSKGYNFVILKDLIETTDEKVRQNLQKLLKKYTWPVMFGKTINSKELFNLI